MNGGGGNTHPSPFELDTPLKQSICCNKLEVGIMFTCKKCSSDCNMHIVRNFSKVDPLKMTPLKIFHAVIIN